MRPKFDLPFTTRYNETDRIKIFVYCCVDAISVILEVRTGTEWGANHLICIEVTGSCKMERIGTALLALTIAALLGCATASEELLPLEKSVAAPKKEAARRSRPVTGSHIKRRSSYPLRIIDRDSVEGAQGATAQDVLTGRD